MHKLLPEELAARLIALDDELQQWARAASNDQQDKQAQLSNAIVDLLDVSEIPVEELAEMSGWNCYVSRAADERRSREGL